MALAKSIDWKHRYWYAYSQSL